MTSVPVRAPERIPFAEGLARRGDLTAVIAGSEVLTYRDLADRVADVAARLGPARRLVQVAASNQLEPVVTYLAALQGGHVVLLTDDDPRRRAALTRAYDPDVVAGPGPTGWDLDERRARSRHQLHPDLALLMSTSGSTGAAKLVRLSADNLRANAAAIAEYLSLREDDRAITSLPLHYCYGLSVLNSHLSVGAGVVLTDRSVVDPAFWEEAARGVTGLAGVPYTFELLERIGEDVTDLPSLRYVTQAGGAMAPDRVRRFAELGQRQGWDLFVMYGQTEATARMAYLPPSLAAAHPGAIGRPIPGGSFEIVPLDDAGLGDGVGELLYRGPNVMLGYAESPEDLALGATLAELRTGDLARRTAAGLYEIVGRRSRFVKLFGRRMELDEVERALARHGIAATCAGDDTGVAVATTTEDGALRAARLVPELLDLPASAVAVREVPQVPRLPSGKPDHAAVLRLVREAASSRGPASRSDGSVGAVFADVLQRPADEDDTFVSLGGDSLSYVEMSMRLEALLGHLPPDWHTTPVGELRAAPGRTGRRLVHRMETGVVIRAVAIALVVGTHAGLFRLQGGAHVLLALAGVNFARFQLRSGQRSQSLLRVAVPSVAWLAGLAVVSDAYDWSNVLLLNGYVGDAGWNPRWRYWFIEALVQILLVATVAFAVPAVRRLERRASFLLPVAVLAAALVMRFDVLAGGEASRRDARAHTVLWLFALGWAIDRATTAPRKALLSAVVLASVPGFFGQPGREVAVGAGLLLLLWIPTIPVVRPLNRVIGLVAGASLYIYLTHWQVYPPLLEHDAPRIAAVAAALVAGLAAWGVAQRAVGAVERRLRLLSGDTSTDPR